MEGSSIKHKDMNFVIKVNRKNLWEVKIEKYTLYETGGLKHIEKSVNIYPSPCFCWRSPPLLYICVCKCFY